MTPQEIKQLRTQHGLTQVQFAAQLLTSERSVQRWESGDIKPPAQVLELMRVKFGEVAQ